MNQSQQSIRTRQGIHLGLQGNCISSAKDNSRSLCRANVLAAHINRVFFRETQLDASRLHCPSHPIMSSPGFSLLQSRFQLCPVLTQHFMKAMDKLESTQNHKYPNRQFSLQRNTEGTLHLYYGRKRQRSTQLLPFSIQTSQHPIIFHVCQGKGRNLGEINLDLI